MNAMRCKVLSDPPAVETARSYDANDPETEHRMGGILRQGEGPTLQPKRYLVTSDFTLPISAVSFRVMVISADAE